MKTALISTAAFVALTTVGFAAHAAPGAIKVTDAYRTAKVPAGASTPTVTVASAQTTPGSTSLNTLGTSGQLVVTNPSSDLQNVTLTVNGASVNVANQMNSFTHSAYLEVFSANDPASSTLGHCKGVTGTCTPMVSNGKTVAYYIVNGY